MVDLVIVFYVQTSSFQEFMVYSEKAKNVFKDMGSRVKIVMIPSDKSDVKVIPVKCYLNGVVPDTPDNISELINELKKCIDVKHNMAKDAAINCASNLLSQIGNARDRMIENSKAHAEFVLMTKKSSSMCPASFDNLDRICRDVIKSIEDIT